MLSISQLSVRAVRPVQGLGTGVSGPSSDGKPKDAAGAQGAKKAGDSKSPAELSEEDQKTVKKLAARDAEVRAHEQAHAATGGAYAGAPSFEFQRGPDGRNYAVGGEVPIDVSPIPGDPQATIAKMQQVKRAALAPSEPSGADRSIAASADSKIMAARTEQMTQDKEGEDGSDSSTRSDAPEGSFAALERRSASQGAYSSQSMRPQGAGLDRIA